MDTIIDFLKALLGFLSFASSPAPEQHKVEDILPEKSASEEALEELEKQPK